jgi:glutamate-5-semialdehyde dehydrogenase
MVHINEHGSHHANFIIAESTSVGSADGFRSGSGAELSVSTGRIHVRGPVGLKGLVTYKYVLRSQGEEGHIVEEFGRDSGRTIHAPTHRGEEAPFLKTGKFTLCERERE